MNEPIVYMVTDYGLEELQVIRRVSADRLLVADEVSEFEIDEDDLFTDLKEAYTWTRKYLRRKLHEAQLQVSSAKTSLHDFYAKYKERIRELDKSNR